LWSKKEAQAYLAAMIDGEGTVSDAYVTSQRTGHLVRSSARSVRIANTDRTLLVVCGECCELLGIKFRIRERKKTRTIPKHWKKAWDPIISDRESFRRMCAVVPLQSEDKRERLRVLAASYTDSKRPSYRRLRDLYCNRCLSLSAVSDILGVSATTVQYGIPRRSNSVAAQLWWDARKAQ